MQNQKSKTSNQMTKKKFLTSEEQRLLTSNLLKLKAIQERDALYFSLLIATGARVSELLGITKSDLFLSEGYGTIHIKGLKGSNNRDIPLKLELYQWAQEYASKIDGEFLFDVTDSRMRQLWYQVCPTDKKMHSVRHTFAIELYKKCRDLKKVQYALGHRSILNTMVYLEFVEGQDALREFLV